MCEKAQSKFCDYICIYIIDIINVCTGTHGDGGLVCVYFLLHILTQILIMYSAHLSVLINLHTSE